MSNVCIVPKKIYITAQCSYWRSNMCQDDSIEILSSHHLRRGLLYSISSSFVQADMRANENHSGTLFRCKYGLHYFSHHTIFPYSLRFILCSILIRESKTPISRCKNQWLVGSLFLVVSFTTSIFHGLTMVVDTDDMDFLKISTSWK